MRFYTNQHRHYCGIDLHTKTLYVCILDRDGQVLAHKNLPSNPEAFLEAVAPYRDDLVVAVECIFTWYWLADLCAAEGIAFVLGHALYTGTTASERTYGKSRGRPRPQWRERSQRGRGAPPTIAHAERQLPATCSLPKAHARSFYRRSPSVALAAQRIGAHLRHGR